MQQTWSTSGLDLHVDVQGHRVRAGLEEALREAVRSGRLASGTRLPSSRALAVDLGLSRNTVASAYGQLVAEGWLTAAHGSGTRVADTVRPMPAPARSVHVPSARFDLRAGVPDVASFPRTGWVGALRRALAVAPAAALGYGDPRGAEPARAALAGYLARARGVHADPERIVLCSGFAQGLDLLCRALRGTVAVEAFGHRLHREAIAAHGLRVVTAAVDERGAVVSTLGRAAAVLLTPAHQFPLGMTLAAERRLQAVRWGGVVIEDDYDGEFRYDQRPVGALQALAPDSVVYAGTASKSLAPGVRLGWLVLPERLVEPVVEARRLAGGPSVLEQLALAELIRCGAYDRHVRRMRQAYRRRRDRLVAVLPAGARATGIVAGQHVVVELPPGMGEEETVERAAARGLLVEGLGAYAAPGVEHTAALVIGYGTPPEHAFDAALRALRTLLR
jgi:GntR family transcriptional regulator / MocR family aminotransferase